jgi:N-acetylmuramoyl-L-alanine amidase
MGALSVVLALLATAGPGDLTGRTVVLDPGHNGANAAHPEIINRQVAIGGGRYKACNTTGTATPGGYTEARFTLNVARSAARTLTRWSRSTLTGARLRDAASTSSAPRGSRG